MCARSGPIVWQLPTPPPCLSASEDAWQRAFTFKGSAPPCAFQGVSLGHSPSTLLPQLLLKLNVEECAA